MNDDEPMNDHQRRKLREFADRLDVFAIITRDMREATTVGEGRRLLKRVDELADALIQTR